MVRGLQLAIVWSYVLAVIVNQTKRIDSSLLHLVVEAAISQ